MSASPSSSSHVFVLGLLIGGGGALGGVLLTGGFQSELPAPSVIETANADDLASRAVAIRPDNDAVTDIRRAARPVEPGRRPGDPGTDTGPEPDESATAPEAGVASSARFQMMMDELRLLLTTGELERSFQGDDERLLQFLLGIWAQTGQPQRALDLLTRFGVSPNHIGNLYNIANQFQSMGNQAAAGETALLGLRAGPGNTFFLDMLQGIDPEVALAEVEALYALATDETRGARAMERLAMLFLAGHNDQGAAEIDRMIREGEAVPDHIWERFLTADPAGIESRLAALMEAQGAAQGGDLGMRLIRAIEAQGDSARALERIQSLLAEAPNHPGYRDVLARIDPDVALAWSAEQLRQNPTNEILEFHGNQLVAAGRHQEAISVFWQALDQNEHSAAAYQLLRLAPVQAADRLASVADGRSDDELFGDIADALWRAGHRARAEQYWRRASEIDPNDGEWTGNLQALANGVDPLNG